MLRAVKCYRAAATMAGNPRRQIHDDCSFCGGWTRTNLALLNEKAGLTHSEQKAALGVKDETWCSGFLLLSDPLLALLSDPSLMPDRRCVLLILRESTQNLRKRVKHDTLAEVLLSNLAGPRRCKPPPGRQGHVSDN